MNLDRFQALTSRFARLSVAVVGDFCLDRYYEMDPAAAQPDAEFFQVSKRRHEAGGAGTLVNHLAALGIGRIYPVGVAGDDGDALDLRRALAAQPGVRLDYFYHTGEVLTALSTQVLAATPGATPRVCARIEFDPPTVPPPALDDRITEAMNPIVREVNAVILCRWARTAGTGVLTPKLLEKVRIIAEREPRLPIVVQSRGGLSDFPPLALSLDEAQFSRIAGVPAGAGADAWKSAARDFAQQHHQPVFGRLADGSLLGATPKEGADLWPALPVTGAVNDAGADSALTTAVAVARAMDASLPETLALANAAICVVMRQLGTTGAPALAQLEDLFRSRELPPAR